MITYQITRYIHSIVRGEHLGHLMEAFLDRSESTDSFLDDLIIQFKRFLKKGNEELFEENRLKYLTYLDDFRGHIDEVPDLKEKNAIETNLILLRLYELPKKRNNLLVALLVYFYLHNKTKTKERSLFKIIYLYLLIIAYRNRLPERMRCSIVEFDVRSYRSISERIMTGWHKVTRKFPLLAWTKLKNILASVVILSLGAIAWKYDIGTNFLRADVAASGGQGGIFAAGKIAMDTLFLGRVTDGVMSTISGVGLQNLAIIALFAIIIQSFKTGLTNVFVNSLLAKIFDFIGLVFKLTSRAVFYIYNYMIYKLATRFIFRSIDFVVSRGIRPGSILIGFFLACYVGIYLGIISLYAFVARYFLPWNILPWHIALISVALTTLLIYLNLHKDLINFRDFLTECEKSIKDSFEWRKKLEEAKS